MFFKLDSVFQGVRLRQALIVPFVVQIFAAVGLVGYLSFKNGQESVNKLAQHLIGDISNRVDQHLRTYLPLPQQLADGTVDALNTGLLNIRDFQKSGRYFWKQAQINQSIAFIGYYLENGEGVAAQRWPPGKGVNIVEHSLSDGKDYNYATDARGRRTTLIDSTTYFAPQDRWYIDGAKAGKPIWSRIYTAEGFPGYVALSASHPIYDSQHKLLGVLSVDLLLSDINHFLSNIKISPHSDIFIIERDGRLIGSSSSEPTYKVVKNQIQRLIALDSDDPEIRTTARYLQERFGSFKAIQQPQLLELSQGNQPYFVRVSPYQDRFGLDWLVVVVVSKSDFTSQIDANTRITIVLCLAALVVATGLGILTARWITHPLLKLGEASQAIAAGDLEQSVEATGVKETRILSTSFNQMAKQLRMSFYALEESNEVLEKRVEERTGELQLAKEVAESAKEAADTANQSKSEFLANMSHELRTPLNGILGFAQILRRSSVLPDNEKQKVNIISQCGKHLLTLINDILDLSKIEANKMELYPTEFHLPAFLQGVAEMCRIKAESKGIQFNYEYEGAMPAGILGDDKRLRQILINLLSNAIKFTDKGKVDFHISVEKIDDHLDFKGRAIYRLLFRVEDTGIGVAPDHLDKIFLPFEQVGNQKKQAEGTGLGLAISQRIAELMGSKIKIQSQLGKGSIFWFEVELTEANSWIESSQVLEQRPIIGYKGSKRKVLVVDDRWENRSVLVNLLEPLGFEMVEAEDGQVAINKATESNPDLVITDIAMPVMDGYTFMNHFRQMENFAHVPLIVASASVFESDRQKSVDAGATEFLPKPVESEELFAVMQRVLELKWIYAVANKTEALNKQAEETSSGEMVLPSTQEIEMLLELCREGLVREIRNQLERMAQTNRQLVPFARKLINFTKEYKLKQIRSLLEEHLT